MANAGSTSIYRGRNQETFLEVPVSGVADVTLSVEQTKYKVLLFTGALLSAIQVYLPLAAEDDGLTWIVENATTGGFDVTIRGLSGDGVTCGAEDACEVYWNGSAMRPAGGGSSTLIVESSGSTQTVFQLTHQYTNPDFPTSLADHPDYSVFDLRHTNLADTANISNPFDLIWTGLRSRVTYGSATVNARGTEHGATVTVDCLGSDDATNELAAYMGWVRANPASGTPADGVASLWFTDFSLHGNIGAQSALLNGITMLVNSYHADEPSRGRSACCWLVTKPGQGAGREDGHDVAPTHTLNLMLGITGWSGTADGVTRRRAADTGIAIGEWGSGWGTVADDDDSWFGTGISVRGAELAAIQIHDPHANAGAAYVGSAIKFFTGISGRQWNWWLDAASAEAPTVGAFRLHGTNGSVAGRVQWGASNAPALYRSADNTVRWEGKAMLAPASIAAATTSTAQLYVRDDTNPELAIFAGNHALSSVFMNFASTAGSLRIYPFDAATAIDPLRETGGITLRGSYWTGAASANVDGQIVLGMEDDSPLRYQMRFATGGVVRGYIAQDGVWTIGTTRMTDASFNVEGTSHFADNVEFAAAADLGFFGAAVAGQQTVTGAKGGNAALASLLTALAAYGLIVDSSGA